MNSLSLWTIVAAASACATAALAQNTATSRYSEWERHLRDRVNAELSYPDAANKASGDVLVGFQIGVDKKPMNVVLRRSSGNAIFDQAALRLVSRLGRLGSVPTSGRPINEVILKLSFGDPAVTAADFARLARADRQEQFANEQRNREMVSPETRVAQNH